MYAEVTAALASLKTASELASLVLKNKVNAAVTEKAIELQSAIIALQSAVFSLQTDNQALLAENDQLKQKLVNQQHWEAEAQRYTLIQVIAGVFVYMIKGDETETELGAEANQWLCAHCFQKKQKSTLQKGMNVGQGYLFDCPNCKTHIICHPKTREQLRNAGQLLS